MISIRVFHALPELYEPLTVTVCPGFREENLLFGDLTEYTPCEPGFHSVTVTGSESHRVFLQKTLPFFTPEAFTLALISGSHGMDLLLIPDYPCFRETQTPSDPPENSACSTIPAAPSLPPFACLRTVNLTIDPMRYHLYHYGERLLFSDVWFRQITSHKRLLPGKHGIYLKLPGQNAPLIPSVFEARAGLAYTVFVYGSLTGDTLSVLVQKDTPDRDQLSV